jgi:shikimate dehydrogenase
MSTRAIGLLGHPVAHSLSPALQNAALRATGTAAVYLAFDVEPSHMQEAINGLRALGFMGANVTVPHKVAVIPYLDSLSPEASRIGAVNTIVNRSGQLEGHNTDAPGLLRALDADAAFSPRGCHAVIAGTGGAGRAAAFALTGAGCSALTIVNRTLSSAQSLAAALPGIPARAFPLAGAPWPELLASASLLVNTTTLGMGSEGEPLIPGDIHLPAGLVVCDMAYGDKPTRLESLAASRGIAFVPGTSVLLHQGAIAFTMWTGVPAPMDIMRKALDEARARRRGYQ